MLEELQKLTTDALHELRELRELQGLNQKPGPVRPIPANHAKHAGAEANTQYPTKAPKALLCEMWDRLEQIYRLGDIERLKGDPDFWGTHEALWDGMEKATRSGIGC